MYDVKVEPSDKTRRALLKGAGTMTIAAAAGFSFSNVAAAMSQGSSTHMNHSNPALLKVIDTSSNCVKAGEMCREHCIQLFKAGDNSVADCADAVNEMLASCTAMSKLAVYNSRHLKDFMTICSRICKDCEVECRKHEAKHAVCKACAESCAECIQAITAVVA